MYYMDIEDWVDMHPGRELGKATKKIGTSDSWGFLKNIKLFDPEHILQLFQNYPGFPEIPPYKNLGKVRCKNFSIITNDNGESYYHFEVYLTTTTQEGIEK